jgi:uncharacterized protein YbbC (DUF1343 family)
MRTQKRSSAYYPALSVLLLGGAAACAQPPEETAEASSGAPETPAAVLAGVDVLLSDSLGLVRGKRVGLVTNHTGVSTTARPAPPAAGSGAPGAPASGLVTTVDALFNHPEVELVALFTPEHGLSGSAEAGERVASGRHEATGLPIYSLYTAETRRPLPHMLEGVEVLLFDIQDVGARYYTYVYTMALAMQAAGQAGIPFVVLDRPNPIGGVHVQGNLLDTAYASFVGMYPVPMRHGLTPGELARLYRGEFGVQAELHIAPVSGWRRDVWYDQTGLPWTPPSPNMPSLESATHYPGTCLFEGTNLSVGRGTDRAFQWIGAPWLDGAALAERLNAYALPGVRFEPASFTPNNPGDGKWPSTLVHGVRFVATDRASYDPTRAAVAALVETRRMSGDQWQWRASHFDALSGTDQLRTAVEGGRTLAEITASWEAGTQAFARLREPYLIYR